MRVGFGTVASVVTMSFTSEEVKLNCKRFFTLGKRLSVLRDYQKKLRFASGNVYKGAERDSALIKLEVELKHKANPADYEVSLEAILSIEDDIVKDAVEQVEDLQKKLKAASS